MTDQRCRLATYGEAYVPRHVVAFPERAWMRITAAQGAVGTYADEYDWVLGPTPEDAAIRGI